MSDDDHDDQDDIRTLYRSGDPDTSEDAAWRIVDQLKELQKTVLSYHVQFPRGLDDYSLEEMCGSHNSTYRSRRAELVGLGLLEDSGERHFVAGSNRIVWRIKKQQDS
jgi:hypothetical protein